MGMGLGNCSVNSVTYEEDRSRDLQDSVSWVTGKHSLKFGARYLWFQADTGELDSRNGAYQFSNAETAQVADGAVVANTGNSYASFLLGDANYANMQDNPFPAQHSQAMRFSRKTTSSSAKSSPSTMGSVGITRGRSGNRTTRWRKWIRPWLMQQPVVCREPTSSLDRNM